MPIEIDEVTSSTTAPAGGAPAPELVRQVADIVYAMLLEELRIEYERRRLEPVGWVGIQGGSSYGLVR